MDKFDTHFYVRTLKTHPKEWTIVGLFWPHSRYRATCH